MPLLTPFGIVVGLLLGDRISALQGIVPYLFAAITLIGGLGISGKEFVATVKRPKPLGIFLVTSLIIMPAVSWLIAVTAFGSMAEVRTGFILLTAIPTALTGYIWSSIYKGNEPLSLTIIFLGTLVAPVSTPLIVSLLSGSSIAIDGSGMMRSMLFLVVIPTTVGTLINSLSKGKVTHRVAPTLKPFSKIALVAIVIINIATVRNQLIASLSWSYLKMALGALFLAVIAYPIAYGIARLFSMDDADTITLTFAISMRNISAALVLAIQYFPPETALPIIFGILFQQSTAALMASILNRTYFSSQMRKKELAL